MDVWANLLLALCLQTLRRDADHKLRHVSCTVGNITTKVGKVLVK